MLEKFQAGQIESDEDKKDKLREEKISLAFEMFLQGEVFPFPGIKPDAYNKIKAEQEDDDYPSFCTPIDELLVRFENEGLKIVLGTHPESGNVFILPRGSNDIEADSLLPRHLSIDEVDDERLLRLIQL